MRVWAPSVRRKNLTVPAQIFIMDTFTKSLGMSDSMTVAELVDAVKSRQKEFGDKPSQSQSILNSIQKIVGAGHLRKEDERLSTSFDLIRPHSNDL